VSSSPVAEVGIFGGSGLYQLLDGHHEVAISTPYGDPSSPLHVGDLDGVRVAFLPRHGAGHRHPAHSVPYRANMWALHQAGVRAVLAPFSCGSLRAEIPPGDFVVCDQLVDRTKQRRDTYFDGPTTNHITFAEPYCAELRVALLEAASGAGVTAHDGGTVVVIEGPRFSTRAESRWFSSQGWDIVNMTQHPEAPLAAELGLCYAGIGLVTDYDAGLDDNPDAPPVTIDEVFANFGANIENVREVLRRAVGLLPRVVLPVDSSTAGHCAARTGGIDVEPPAQ
jgi:5'-methylthioadenosine phosphorylase